MSVLTYNVMHDESKGQATYMDAWRGEDTSIFKVGQAAGRIFVATPAAGRKDFHATFSPDAFDWPTMPRIAHPG